MKIEELPEMPLSAFWCLSFLLVYCYSFWESSEHHQKDHQQIVFSDLQYVVRVAQSNKHLFICLKRGDLSQYYGSKWWNFPFFHNMPTQFSSCLKNTLPPFTGVSLRTKSSSLEIYEISRTGWIKVFLMANIQFILLFQTVILKINSLFKTLNSFNVSSYGGVRITGFSTQWFGRTIP